MLSARNVFPLKQVVKSIISTMSLSTMLPLDFTHIGPETLTLWKCRWNTNLSQEGNLEWIFQLLPLSKFALAEMLSEALCLPLWYIQTTKSSSSRGQGCLSPGHHRQLCTSHLWTYWAPTKYLASCHGRWGEEGQYSAVVKAQGLLEPNNWVKSWLFHFLVMWLGQTIWPLKVKMMIVPTL